jgi:alpha-L-fucosidase
VPWETCLTICRQWAWKPEDEMKSLEECLHALIYSAGGDGNLLLNVGPMPDGRIEPRQVERLKEMGQWLAKYGESIYGTRGGPFKPGEWGASTCKENKIYLHVMTWPNADLRLPAIGRNIMGYRVLTGGKATVNQSSSGIRISMAERERQPIDTVIVLTIDRRAFDVEPLDVETPPEQ